MRIRSPGGTTESPASPLSRPYGTGYKEGPSIPSTEVLGYYQTSLRDAQYGCVDSAQAIARSDSRSRSSPSVWAITTTPLSVTTNPRASSSWRL